MANLNADNCQYLTKRLPLALDCSVFYIILIFIYNFMDRGDIIDDVSIPVNDVLHNRAI